VKTVPELRVELATLRKKHRQIEKQFNKKIQKQYEHEFLVNLR
jgi:hypothetical protein